MTVYKNNIDRIEIISAALKDLNDKVRAYLSDKFNSLILDKNCVRKNRKMVSIKNKIKTVRTINKFISCIINNS